MWLGRGTYSEALHAGARRLQRSVNLARIGGDPGVAPQPGIKTTHLRLFRTSVRQAAGKA